METNEALRSLSALAHESRLAIFRLLVERGRSGLAAGQIALRLQLPAATASFHLKELAGAGLIVGRQESRFIHYAANFAAINAVIGYLTDNCCREDAACFAECNTQCAPAPQPSVATSTKDPQLARRRR